jgi:hypothetical protein
MVQFTASEEYVKLVEEARALLAHALPSRDLAQVHLRAMRTLVAELKKRKYAVSVAPASTEIPCARGGAHDADNLCLCCAQKRTSGASSCNAEAPNHTRGGRVSGH